jgi:leucyl-tRNA synthetase
VGWDAFGLPAENYAIKAGVSPQESMATIIPSYHKQYKAMGWSNDWEKEISTHLPEYYKWTQWIFSEMYRNKLAYQDARMQWWCSKCQTVLANEQVIDGKCWRHDASDDPQVEKKEVKQWFFKITDYADELLESIDGLDWTESVKLAQKNWIGKSEGAYISFDLEQDKNRSRVYDVPEINVFSTRPDTLYGATFLIIAPDHKDAPLISTNQQEKTVDEYILMSNMKTDVQRQEGKEKTGVFTGRYAINPINGEKLQVWVADYVVARYGTGAIMAVPAHDERDYEFAQKYSLPIRRVVNNEAPDGECTTDEGLMINSEEFNGQNSYEAREKIVEKLSELGAGNPITTYKMGDWSVSRQRYWGAPIPIVHCEKCGPVLVPDEQLPVELPILDDFQPSGDGRSALARAKDWLEVTCPECGGKAERETDTLDTYICSSWYMYRYFDPHNQEAIFDSKVVKKWEPIDFYNGADHATAHLLYARFIGHFFKKLGLVNEPEPFKQFLFNGKVTAQDGTMFSKSKGNGVDPLDIIDQGYGADALRMYLMFAAPLEFGARWDPRGVPGTHRFLSRLWNLVHEYIETNPSDTEKKIAVEINRSTNAMIKKVTEDIESNRYNTAIAAAMTGLNELYKFKVKHFTKSIVWQKALENITAVIAPFAPHIADELWSKLGHSSSVHIDTWPKYDSKQLATDEITIVIQVNGKVRGSILAPSDLSQDEVMNLAQVEPKVKMHIADQTIKKSIYIKNKLLNIVV